MKVLETRKGDNKVKNWYLDMTAIAKYLMVEGGAPRSYHHTAPISMVYGFREALQLVAEVCACACACVSWPAFPNTACARVSLTTVNVAVRRKRCLNAGHATVPWLSSSGRHWRTWG